MDESTKPLLPGWPLAVLCMLPTVVTWLYFVVLAEAAPVWQQLTAGLGKAIQFGFPVGWLMWVGHPVWTWPRWNRSGLVVGLLFGLLVVAAMEGLYLGLLRDAASFAGPREAIREKVQAIGLQSTAQFAGLGVFYALAHSGLEEYFWRWFVFGQCRRRLSVRAAVVVSSIGFMAHHVIVLAVYFGWTSPATYLFSLSVAVGGAVWAWLYHRTGHLWSCWLSHLVVDAGIFLVGYQIVHDLF